MSGFSASIGRLGRSPMIDDVRRRLSWPLEFCWALLGAAGGFVGAVIVLVVVSVVAIVAVALASKGDTSAMEAAVAAMQSSEPPKTATGQAVLVGSLAVINTLFVIILVVLATVIRKRRIFANFTSARRFRWRQLGLGFALYAVAFAAIIAFEATFGGQKLEWPALHLAATPMGTAAFCGFIVIAFLIAAAAEEIMFRGWLLRETATFTRNLWILLLVNGVLFSAIHINPQTWQLDPNAFIARTALGIGFVYMTLRFGGIEFSTGAHAANNILLTLAVEPLSLVEPPPEPLHLGSLMETAVFLALCIGITELAARVPALRRIGGIEDAPDGPEADVFA
jgi:membrane protease YdiL (CAAX protease family)